MNQDRTKRKLTAIFSADAVGYSRLMEEDEAWTIKSLEENKRLISELVEEYEGRVVDAPGDNILAEFSSVTNAVECAVKIQQELKKKNANIVENRRMEFRIGINLGEIVEEGGRIYGSGVNIAARIEGLSKSGGICISGRTYDHIKTKFDFGYEYLGEHEVKNISEPVRVYRVLTGFETAGKVIGEKKVSVRIPPKISIAAIIVLIIIAAGLLFWNIYSHQARKIETVSIEPEQAPAVVDVEEAHKTIAVLPFVDMSPEKDQDYFVDGLSEELINCLTQISDLHVTSRQSSFTFKNSDKTTQEIAEILGREYILEGSVRKVGNDLRITAQLIHAADDRHLWSETYDKELKDIFAIQEDIANSVADKLKLTLEAIKRLGGTDNVEAYEVYLIAQGQINTWESKKALESAEAAIALDPNFALPWVTKGFAHSLLAIFGSADSAASELDAALNAAERAIELEPRLREAYFLLNYVETNIGEYIKAESAYSKALELPTETLSSYEYVVNMHYHPLGYFKKAQEILRKTLQNDPLHPIVRGHYMLNLAFLGDMQGAEEEYEHGMALFEGQWMQGDNYITTIRLGSGDVMYSDIVFPSKIYNSAKEHLDSPKEGLSELHRIYTNNDNLSSDDFFYIAICAAYFGDNEFALTAMEKGLGIQTSGAFYFWFPVMKEVRQLPRFKKFVREIGLVDYWNKFGWPDICHQLENGDFECD